mgnify:CR=1 FL=1
MQEFLQELIRIEINDKEKCFNGFYSAEAYTKYLNELYSTADMTALTNELYLFATEKQLEDYMVMLDAYLPMYLETVQNMQHDAMISPYLQEEADWYQTLYEIRNAKEFYYNKFLEILNYEKQEKREIVTQEDNNSLGEYITYKELIAKYNFKGGRSITRKRSMPISFTRRSTIAQSSSLKTPLCTLAEKKKGSNSTLVP